jgi:arabinogalactan endo-1,4-beta-galactosidase
MHKNFYLLLIITLSLSLLACNVISQKSEPSIYLGADLSYVNEVEDCGAKFNYQGQEVEPFKFFADNGANIVRLRLWHNPSWTSYGNLKDVKKSIARAKSNNMTVLLDFHYSDNWADPAHQIIPSVWSGITDTEILGDSLYNYTYAVLKELKSENLLPEMVQVGNETNSEIMMEQETAKNGPTDWVRNASLLSKGLKAIKDFNTKEYSNIETMLHVAQPDNAKNWFEDAATQKLNNYDWIGLSYYPNWSKFDLDGLKGMISYLKETHNKKVMVVEAGYPYSNKNFDNAGNVLGEGSDLTGYPISPEGQLSFMVDLTDAVTKGGGAGVIYWEAAWVSSTCKTQWGTGSHWENAAFFDAGNKNEALPVFQFFSHKSDKL